MKLSLPEKRASKKSASTSKPPNKLRSLKRKRTLKRGCAVEPLDTENETHLFYMWAAYKRGILEPFTEGLDRNGFIEELNARTEFTRQNGDVTLLIGQTKRDMIPVGVVIADAYQGRAWPHVLWFPEASTRNRVECALKYLVWLKETIPALVVCNGKDVPFFAHLAKYGVIRPVGKMRGFYPDSDGHLYETVGNG